MAKKKTRSTKKSRQSRSFTRRTSLSPKRLLIFALAFGAVGGAYLAISLAFNNNGPPKPFVEDRARGLHWGGLKVGTGACAKLFEMVDSHGKPQGCATGPEPAPEGVDVTKSVEALSTGASTAVSTSGIICDGDGTTGNRFQMIYAHTSDVADRYNDFAASFQQYAANLNSVYVESGNQTGSPRNIRFVTDSACNVSVADVTLSAAGDDNFSNTVSELRAQGYNRSDRKYAIWMDATVYCGISGLWVDSRPTQDNPNNSGNSFSRTDSGCWGGGVEAHEMMHELGAVSFDAPHTSGNTHCNDGYDRMCYADGGSTSNYTTTACADPSSQNYFDCNKDDYFNTSTTIPTTNYLASHWNAANNRFLIAPYVPPPPPPADTTLPSVIISSPANGSFLGNKTRIYATATDNVGVTKMEVYVDGQFMGSTPYGVISISWNSHFASRGQHSVIAKAYDAAGNIGQATIFVYK